MVYYLRHGKERMQESTKDKCEPVLCPSCPLLMEVSNTSLAIEWSLAFIGCMRRLAAKPCIVLDIDGTILINMPDGRSKCVPCFGSLCKACHMNGIDVFCVTARPDEAYNRKYTERQLEKCNVAPITQLFMRPPRAEYGTYKFKARKNIATRGYTILLTIGDQFADVRLKDPPKEIHDDRIYIGQISDGMQFGIKLPSEFL